MNLHTRAGYISLGDQYRAEVIDGGALQLTDDDGAVSLIGPGFWVAVTPANGRLDSHDMLVVEGQDD